VPPPPLPPTTERVPTSRTVRPWLSSFRPHSSLTSLSVLCISPAHQQTQEQEIRDAHSQKYEEGTENAHSLLDTKDERSIKNTLAAAEKKEKEEAEREARPEPLPTAAAKAHGNEPSRGAKIDEQCVDPSSRLGCRRSAADPAPLPFCRIMIEEEIELAKKEAAGKGH